MGAIILFDGECNFCNKSVQFIINRDADAYFHFASLQGEVGQKLLTTYSIKDFNSIVLVEQEKVYQHSSAALRICKHLNGGWKLFSLFLLIPRLIRDPFYSIIAANRYKWFGKQTSCMIPTEDVRKRFLD